MNPTTTKAGFQKSKMKVFDEKSGYFISFIE